MCPQQRRTLYDYKKTIYDKNRGKHIYLTGAKRKSRKCQPRYLIAIINIFITPELFISSVC